MGQINLHESLDFPGVVLPSRLNKFAWSPQLTSHYFGSAMHRGIKIVPQLICLRRDRPKFVQGTEGTEVALNAMFLQK